MQVDEHRRLHLFAINSGANFAEPLLLVVGNRLCLCIHDEKPTACVGHYMINRQTNHKIDELTASALAL